ncbi:hypothetical protein D5Q04_19915 [Salmonella enterica subsp. enterica serovar Thompson]|nr:hypothetical protein [Salmonella enterica subsp. enterica serovar Thompson]
MVGFDHLLMWGDRDVTNSELEALYKSAINFVFAIGKFDSEYLKKGMQITDDDVNQLIEKMISHGAISDMDESGIYTPLKTYIHSEYLLQQEREDDAIKEETLKTKKANKNIGLVIFSLAVVVFLVTCFFAFREPMALPLVIPLVLLCFWWADKWKWNIGIPSTLSIIVCALSLSWVNSISPLWGERYESKMEYERLKSAVNEDEHAKIRKISIGQVAVKELLKDPSSAKFSGDYVGKSGAVCGYVNAKNSFGAYSGKDRYIYNGGAYIDDGGKDFSSLWRKLCR